MSVGGFNWNELTTQDAQAAVDFYEKVFGFTHEEMPMPAGGSYIVLKSGDLRRGGIFKARDASMPTLWMQYVKVADCDASAARAARLGAQVLVTPSDIAGVGRFAMFVDPQGAALAVMKPNDA